MRDIKTATQNLRKFSACTLLEVRGLPIPCQVKNCNCPGFQSATASGLPLVPRSPANHSATLVRGDEHERRFTGATAVCRRPERENIAGQTGCSAASRGATRISVALIAAWAEAAAEQIRDDTSSCLGASAWLSTEMAQSEHFFLS